MSTIYRLVYASKNLIVGPAADARRELDGILAVSRRNNARMGVNGALIFNGAAFGHGLEGPRRTLEETFERIQRDIRHGEVTVLAWGPVAVPGFRRPLDFVGGTVRARALWSDLLSASGFDLARLDGGAVAALLQRLVGEQGPAAQTSGPDLPTHPAPSAPPAPPVAAAPLTDAATKVPPPRPAAPSPAASMPSPASSATGAGTWDLPTPQAAPVPPKSVPPQPKAMEPPSQSRSERHAAVAVAILKAALADERSRTSALRAEVDELRITLTAGRAEIASLRAERDLWAERARLMAAALRDNPREIRSLVRSTADALMTRDGAVQSPLLA